MTREVAIEFDLNINVITVIECCNVTIMWIASWWRWILVHKLQDKQSHHRVIYSRMQMINSHCTTRNSPSEFYSWYDNSTFNVSRCRRHYHNGRTTNKSAAETSAVTAALQFTNYICNPFLAYKNSKTETCIKFGANNMLGLVKSHT